MEGAGFLDWAIGMLEGIERAPDKQAWCREYSAYGRSAGPDGLLRELYDFADRARETGLVIANYSEVIARWRLDERDIMRADAAWLARQPYLCVLAGIAWHFRRDHFCEGTLINSSVAGGAMLRLLRRLRELCPTAAPAVTVQELCSNGCRSIPASPGVYWVLAPEGMPIHFRERPYRPGALLYPAAQLREKLESGPDRTTLYIGKAEGRHGLRRRLKQYMDYGQGRGNVHRGGRAIWQIEDCGLLLLAYETCEQPGEREHRLLREYREKNGAYPPANWRG